jgi:hypothetical protein
MKDTEDKWYELLSDDKKAEVLKTKIQEEATIRRSEISTDGYWASKILRPLFLAIVFVIALIVSCHYIDAKYPGTPTYFDRPPVPGVSTSSTSTATSTATKE